MRFRASEVAAVTGGRLSGDDVDVDGASVDSRTLRSGALFVPIVAVRDGHEFVEDALAKGAAAYLTSRGDLGGSAVLVADTRQALRDLGAAARARVQRCAIAVTGSAGKTTTKDLLASAVGTRFRAAASERSFNNDLGVPLTLLDAPDDTEVVVLEMGARRVGDLERLAAWAAPDVAVVTNVGPAHIEVFGSIEGVARAKSELVAALPPDGTAVLNADDERVMGMAGVTSAKVLTFGTAGGEVRAADVVLDDELRVRLTLLTPWGSAAVRLSGRGRHQAANAAAAAAAALTVGVDLTDVAQGLEHASLSPWRMELVHTDAGAVVVNDTYNANPASTEAALRALAELPATRRIAVLGPMLELGDLAAAEHHRIGELARSLGIDRLYTVGAPSYGGEELPDLDAAGAVIAALGDGDAALVKASRAAGLERAVAKLRRSGS